MKKILMTSGAALMLSAGYASANALDTISFAGDGRMGVVYDNTNDDEFSIDSRVRGYFFFDAETDTGLGFGGRIRIGNAAGAQDSDLGGSGYNHVYVESEFGRVEVGDVASAAQAATGDITGSVGFTGIGFQNETDFLVRDFNGGLAAGAINAGGGSFESAADNDDFDDAFTSRNKALYIYELDAFSVFGSTGAIDGPFRHYSVGARYDAGMFAASVGFEYAEADDGWALVDNDDIATDGGDATHLTGSVEGSFDMFDAKLVGTYAGGDLGDSLDDADLNQWQLGVGAGTTFDLVSVNAFARQDFFKDRHFGVGASYDLGGGASIDAGIRHTRVNDDDDDNVTQADLGVSMSF